MILRSGKFVSVLYDSQIPFTMANANVSNTLVSRSSGQENQYFAHISIAACEDVMKYFSITDNGADIAYVHSQCVTDFMRLCFCDTAPYYPLMSKIVMESLSQHTFRGITNTK